MPSCSAACGETGRGGQSRQTAAGSLLISRQRYTATSDRQGGRCTAQTEAGRQGGRQGGRHNDIPAVSRRFRRRGRGASPRGCSPPPAAAAALRGPRARHAASSRSISCLTLSEQTPAHTKSSKRGNSVASWRRAGPAPRPPRVCASSAYAPRLRRHAALPATI